MVTLVPVIHSAHPRGGGEETCYVRVEREQVTLCQAWPELQQAAIHDEHPTGLWCSRADRGTTTNVTNANLPGHRTLAEKSLSKKFLGNRVPGDELHGWSLGRPDTERKPLGRAAWDSGGSQQPIVNQVIMGIRVHLTHDLLSCLMSSANYICWND